MKNQTQAATSEPNNSFDKTLREIRSGLLLDECSQSLENLVAAVLDTGKKGKLTIKMTVKPASKGEAVCVMIEDELTVVLPTIDKPSTIFYADDNHVLQRSDPRQKELELREIGRRPEVPLGTPQPISTPQAVAESMAESVAQ